MSELAVVRDPWRQHPTHWSWDAGACLCLRAFTSSNAFAQYDARPGKSRHSLRGPRVAGGNSPCRGRAMCAPLTWCLVPCFAAVLLSAEARRTAEQRYDTYRCSSCRRSSWREARLIYPVIDGERGRDSNAAARDAGIPDAVPLHTARGCWLGGCHAVRKPRRTT